MKNDPLFKATWEMPPGFYKSVKACSDEIEKKEVKERTEALESMPAESAEEKLAIAMAALAQIASRKDAMKGRTNADVAKRTLELLGN